MKKMISLFVFILICMPTLAHAATNYEPTPFNKTQDAMADVDMVLAKAKAEEKLALIVLGANWCHDSRGLAQRLESEEMSELMEESYELIYVDIGYYESNMNLVTRFGLPIMFGTPTVLVVDPKTEKLLNKNSMNKWLDAALVSLEDTKDHFTQLLSAEPVEIKAEQSPQLKALFEKISNYEKEQILRITKGYKVLGPMIEARVKGEGDNDVFMDYWTQLSKMRYGLANGLIALRQEAIRRDQAGEENIKLAFPSYPPFTWE